ncbi:class I SAM-dependent methyltransferase [Neorhodopirellula pilleata]|uniref:Methyltransferase domain-containing protein n=1 Tax=Neorhodopirellula pilleata TaxID=2714738 RepID=A0A5C6B005_9BACT|nr:class I SAM-dependent methyltransferase [Neorhodopirellula pilleata]TWU03734.1 hypothetical protein Pla100_06640 [Neorhodopirellula pilleata]
MSAQDRTLDHYQELMTINATSHVLRAGRRLGVFDQLAEGQKTLPALAENLQIAPDRLLLLIESLIAIGIIEQYQEDYALSSTARLLCQYDADLDDATWEQLADTLKTDRPTVDRVADDEVPQQRFDSIAATQWVHTPAAMQVAEILNLGPPEEDSPEAEVAALELLDLGCGSAVWSCAMGFRDPLLQITAIDTEPALVAAKSTATSIGLGERFSTQVGDLLTCSLKADTFDLVVVAQRLHSLADNQIETVLRRCHDTLKEGGKLIVIDSFRGPHRPSLAESLEALRMQVQTHHGNVPDLAAAQSRIERAGFTGVQFTFIAASRLGLGLMVGTKP